MAQIKISELPATEIGSGVVPIVQDGETKKFDLAKMPSYWTTPGSRSFSNLRGFGCLTNGSKTLELTIPYALAYSGTYTINSLSMLARFPYGGYGYARSGSSGGTYTSLVLEGGGVVSIWNNGSSVRTNEVSSIVCGMVSGAYIQVRINFVYALCSNSTGTVIANNVPITGIFTFDITRS